MDTVTPTEIEPLGYGPEEAGAAIRQAQDELERAVQHANLTKDPLRLPLGALAVTLGAMHKLFVANLTHHRLVAGEMDRRAEEVARHPIDPLALQALVKAAATGADRRAGDLARAQARRTAMIAGAILAGSVLTTAAVFGLGGYWWGHSSAVASIHETEAGLDAAFAAGPEAATGWMNLMRLNDLNKVLAACAGDRGYTDPNGRRACNAPLWLEPERPGAPPKAR